MEPDHKCYWLRKGSMVTTRKHSHPVPITGILWELHRGHYECEYDANIYCIDTIYHHPLLITEVDCTRCKYYRSK